MIRSFIFNVGVSLQTVLDKLQKCISNKVKKNLDYIIWV
jgi:hypothetical protein